MTQSPSKIRRFEAYLGNWLAWVTDDITKITKKSSVVTIVTTHPDHGVLTTTFDLKQIPAYTIG